MKKHAPITKTPVRDFFLRGFMFGGSGPIIAGIVYLILHFTLQDLTLDGLQVFTAIISTYLLAFVHAGASVFHQIESWSLGKSALCQLSLLYVAYALCYIVNTWLPFDPLSLGIFTGIFIGGYGVIWLIIYFSIKATVRKLNRELQ